MISYVDIISDYTITKTPLSRCSKCYCNVYILSNDEQIEPSFFICFTCNKIWEVGVGECIHNISYEN